MKRALFITGLIVVPGALTGYLIYKLYKKVKVLKKETDKVNER